MHQTEMLARRTCDFKRLKKTANERLAGMVCSSLERTDALIELQFLMNASRLITIPSSTTDLDSDKTAIPFLAASVETERELLPIISYPPNIPTQPHSSLRTIPQFSHNSITRIEHFADSDGIELIRRVAVQSLLFQQQRAASEVHLRSIEG